MSGPYAGEHASHSQQEVARLRRRGAELAQALAATEEQVADTLEEIARNRPAADAERLRGEAEIARQYAARLRKRSAESWPWPADSGRQG